jgi:hypothetical protein
VDVSANKQLSSPSIRLLPPPTAAPSRDEVTGWVPAQFPHRSEGSAQRVYGLQDVERSLPRQINIGPQQPILHGYRMAIAKDPVSPAPAVQARPHTTQPLRCWPTKRSEHSQESTVTRSANLQQYPYFSIADHVPPDVQDRIGKPQQHVSLVDHSLGSRSRGFSGCSQKSSHETLDWLKHPRPVPEYAIPSTHHVASHGFTDKMTWRHDSHRDLFPTDGYGDRESRQGNDNLAMMRNTSHAFRSPSLISASNEKLPIPPLPPRSPFRLDHVDKHAVSYLNSRSLAIHNGSPRLPTACSTWPKRATAVTDSSWDYRMNGTRFREHFEDDGDKEYRAPRPTESHSGSIHQAAYATFPSRHETAYDPRTRSEKPRRASLRNVFANQQTGHTHLLGRTVQEIAAAPFAPLPTHTTDLCTPNASTLVQHTDRQRETTWSQYLALSILFLTCTVLAACNLASYPTGILLSAPASLRFENTTNATSAEADHLVITDLAKPLGPGIKTPTFGSMVLLAIVTVAVYTALCGVIEWAVRCVGRRWVQYESRSAAMGFWVRWVRGFMGCMGAWRETLGVLGGACGAGIVVAGVVWGVLA